MRVRGEPLGALRAEVERVDAELVRLLAERAALARRIGAAKRALGRPTLDPPREAAVVRRAAELARAAGVADEEGVRGIFWQLVAMARRAQDGGPG